MKNTLQGYKKLSLDIKIYPVEAVINACYVFIDTYYFYLDSPDSNKIEVYFKPKKNIRKNQSVFVHEFKNELLYAVLRLQLAKKNKRLREYIVGSALFSTTISPEQEQTAIGLRDTKLEDPLGIGMTWEEKYGNKKPRNRS